jgi:putrescine transport system substrate-binding protein
MKKVASIAALAAFAATSALAQDKVVHVFNWSDYIAEDTISLFEAETGIKVTYDVYDSDEFLETKMLAGNSGYDVVVPSAEFLQRLVAAGVYAEIDKSKLPNLKNMDPQMMAELANFDPDNAHGVINMWGTTGLGFNVSAVEERLGKDAPTDSWSLILDPKNAEKLKDCGISILDSPTHVIPIAMNYLGLDPHSTEKADIEKGINLLIEISPYVRYFSSSKYITDLANGDVCVSIGWSGDVFQSRARAEEAGNGITVGYSIPKEGALQWFDVLAIPADSENKDEAHAFINFMMDARITANNTNYVWYANANTASLPMVDQEILDDPGIFPTDEARAKLWGGKVYDSKTTRMITRLWTTLKTGQ